MIELPSTDPIHYLCNTILNKYINGIFVAYSLLLHIEWLMENRQDINISFYKINYRNRKSLTFSTITVDLE